MVSRRFGYCCAIAFAMSPWLGEAVRQPWFFNTLSCFLHFSTLYSFLSLCEDPGSLRYRLAAPAGLAAYLFVGLDWPSFLFSLGLFLVACGRLRAILKNPYNFLVLAAAAVQVAWPAALFLTGRKDYLGGTLLLYPFLRYGELSSNLGLWSDIWKDVIVGWGPQLAFAAVGLAAYVIRLRRTLFTDRLRRALFDSMCVWFVGASYALFRSCTSATYLYVVATPDIFTCRIGPFTSSHSLPCVCGCRHGGFPGEYYRKSAVHRPRRRAPGPRRPRRFSSNNAQTCSQRERPHFCREMAPPTSASMRGVRTGES